MKNKGCALDMTKINRSGRKKTKKIRRGSPPTRYVVAEALREGLTETQMAYSNIHPEKTAQNWNLGPERTVDEVMEFIDDIRNDPASADKRAIRSDSPDLLAWVIYPPEGWCFADEGDERTFFQRSFDFMQNEFGEDNLAFAVVHRDQGRPHMQLAYIPRTKDGKWSSKKAASMAIMKTIHAKFDQEVSLPLGMPPSSKAERPHLTKEELIELNQHRATELAKIKLEIANAKADADTAVREALEAQKLALEGRKETERSFALLQQKMSLIEKLLCDADDISSELALTLDEADQLGRVQEQGRDFLANVNAALREVEKDEFHLH